MTPALTAPEFLAAVGTIVVATVAAIIRSWKHPDGRIRKALTENGEARSAHKAIPRVEEKLDQINGKVDRTYGKVETLERDTKDLGEKVEEMGRAMVVIHADDDHVAHGSLRDRLGVEDLDEDFLRGGDRNET